MGKECTCIFAWEQGVLHAFNRDVSDQSKNLQDYCWSVFNGLFTVVFSEVV